MRNLVTDSPIAPSLRRAVLIMMVAMAAPTAACGEDAEPVEGTGTARVGESCARNSDCRDGLLCKGGDLRCVKLCEIGSDACGEGIVCEPANDGEIGFCPLPPP